MMWKGEQSFLTARINAKAKKDKTTSRVHESYYERNYRDRELLFIEQTKSEIRENHGSDWRTNGRT